MLCVINLEEAIVKITETNKDVEVKSKYHYILFVILLRPRFQHSPRDLANVNEWKIMFDPYSDINHFCRFQPFLLQLKETRGELL